jgi:hypothetical protein
LHDAGSQWPSGNGDEHHDGCGEEKWAEGNGCPRAAMQRLIDHRHGDGEG